MKENSRPDKNEILEQIYVSADDLEILMPGMAYNQRLALIKDIRVEMEQKNIYVPQGRVLLASTKLLKKKCGI